jgi:predicted permease
VLEAVRALPGVTAVGLTNKLPLSGEGSNNGLHANDGAMAPDDWPVVDYRSVSPGYFGAIGIPLLRGRLIQDTDGSHPVAVISATTATRVWPSTDPIGHSFQLGDSESPAIEVVGVVGDVHGASLQKAPSPTVYMPFWQRLRSPSVFAVRTAGDPAAVEAELQVVLHQLQPDAPRARVRAMDAVVDASVAERRFQVEVVLFFATIGVLLAGIGVYGVVAQSVARRTREIGLRMALGATRADVWRLVARQGLAPVAVGLAVGLVGAVGAGQVVRGLLFGVTVTDVSTFGTVTVALGLASLVACYLPARRATRLDPTTALRTE